MKRPICHALFFTTIFLLSACGQRGALYIPDSPAAKNRATLPETIYNLPKSPKGDEK